MVKISKKFKWEMGHRLMNHKGLCANPHGHSYQMQVILEGNINNDGMLMDYNDLEVIVNDVIKDFNHSFVVNSNDTIMKDFLKVNNFKHIVLEYEPTSENLCNVFANLIRKKLYQFTNIEKLTIRLYETKSVYAEIKIGVK